jgi:hypothetical protein
LQRQGIVEGLARGGPAPESELGDPEVVVGERGQRGVVGASSRSEERSCRLFGIARLGSGHAEGDQRSSIVRTGTDLGFELTQLRGAEHAGGKGGSEGSRERGPRDASAATTSRELESQQGEGQRCDRRDAGGGYASRDALAGCRAALGPQSLEGQSQVDLTPSARCQKPSIRGGDQLRERREVPARYHHAATCIVEESSSLRDRRSLLAPEDRRHHADPEPHRFGNPEVAASRVLTIADQEQGLRAVAGGIEGAERRSHALADRRATLLDQVRRECGQHATNRACVGGERCEQDPTPREGRQGDTVARGELRQDPPGRLPRSDQSARRSVARHHAGGDVHEHDDVYSRRANPERALSEPGPEECQRDGRGGDQERRVRGRRAEAHPASAEQTTCASVRGESRGGDRSDRDGQGGE